MKKKKTQAVKTAILASAFVAVSLSLSAQSITTNRFSEFREMFKETDARKSKACPNMGVYLKWQNTSTEPMDLQFAMQRSDGTWRIKVYENVLPGQIIEDDYCKTSGAHTWWARPTAQKHEVRFPTETKIASGNY